MIPYNCEITGRIIRSLRIRQNLSQEVLSGLAGVARSHLAMIEAGTKNASVDTLWRIADALGLRADPHGGGRNPLKDRVCAGTKPGTGSLSLLPAVLPAHFGDAGVQPSGELHPDVAEDHLFHEG